MVIDKLFVDVINVKDHFELNKFQKGTEKKKLGQQVNQQRKKSTRRYNARRNKSTEVLIFQLPRFIVISVLMVILAISLQLCSYFWIESLNNTAKNVLMAYLTGIENWCAFVSMWSMAILTVRYNDTIPAWETQSSYELYKYFENYTQTNVLDNFTSLLSADLHNYTNNYSVVFDTGDSCQDWLIHTIPWCMDNYMNGFTRDNFIVLFTGIRTQMMGFIQRWQNDRSSWAAMDKNWIAEETKDLFGGFSRLMSKSYYMVTLPTQDTIKELARSNGDVLYFITGISFVCIILLMLILVIGILLPLNATISCYIGAVFMIPHPIIESNMELKHYLMRKYKQVKG